MPTDSIFNNVDIKDKKSVERFIAALEEANKKEVKIYKIPNGVKIIWKGEENG